MQTLILGILFGIGSGLILASIYLFILARNLNKLSKF